MKDFAGSQLEVFVNIDVAGLLGGFRENAWVLELAEMRFREGNLADALKIAVILKEHIEIHGELRSLVVLLPRTDDLISRILYGRTHDRLAATRPAIPDTKSRAACPQQADCTCCHSLEGKTLKWALRIVFVSAVARFLASDVHSIVTAGVGGIVTFFGGTW